MQIAPGLYSMRQQEGGRVHAYLLDDGNALTLIDTLYDDDANVVLAELARIGKKPTEIKNIILTHAHKSHLGGLAALKKATNATVFSHEWEVDIIAGRRKAEKVPAFPPRKPLAVYPLQLGLALGRGKHQPCEVDRRLKAGDRVGPLEVVETPGHPRLPVVLVAGAPCRTRRRRDSDVARVCRRLAGPDARQRSQPEVGPRSHGVQQRRDPVHRSRRSVDAGRGASHQEPRELIERLATRRISDSLCVHLCPLCLWGQSPRR
jgi:Metallo-beta-lactamase superfamily